MKFFKYLIFTILLLFSVTAFSAVYVIGDTGIGSVTTGSSAVDVCQKYVASYNKYWSDRKSPQAGVFTSATEDACKFNWSLDGKSLHIPASSDIYKKESSCPAVGFPAIYDFAKGSPIPKTRCLTLTDGSVCEYSDGGSPSDMGDHMIVYLHSMSTKPNPNCKKADIGVCDKTDPYGGCYSPPNDGCTRGSDGSIYCPSDSPPPEISKGCSGNATYCDRPPQGCGSEYVSGNFNGKAVCVRKSGSSTGSGTTSSSNNADGSNTSVTTDSSGNPVSTTVTAPDGSKTSTSVNSNGTSTTTTTNSNGQTTGTSAGTTTTNKNSDGSTTITTITNNNTTVINISSDGKSTTTTINKGTPDEKTTSGSTDKTKDGDSLDLSGVINAVNRVADKITWLKNELVTSLTDISTKISTTNSKLDDTNKKLDEGNKNTSDIKDKLDKSNEKLDKIEKNGSDLNDYLKGCKTDHNGNKSCQDPFQPPASEADASIPKKELEQKSFNENLLGLSAPSCPPDFQINWQTPFGTIDRSFSYQDMCDSSSWLGYLFLAIAYLIGARIVMGDS